MEKQHATKRSHGQLDCRLLDFFTANYKPGVIGIIGTSDRIGQLIRKAQGRLTTGGMPSWWDHCFIMGELREDRRGPRGRLTRSLYILESAFDTEVGHHRFDSGTQEAWVGKWCQKDIEHAGVIDFGLSKAESRIVLATALQLVSERYFYPVRELVGTWVAVLLGHVDRKNPFDDPHAMYCSSFVRHCFRAAGRDFLDPKVSVSNTTPEHLAAAAHQAGCLKVLR